MIFLRIAFVKKSSRSLNAVLYFPYILIFHIFSLCSPSIKLNLPEKKPWPAGLLAEVYQCLSWAQRSAAYFEFNFGGGGGLVRGPSRPGSSARPGKFKLRRGGWVRAQAISAGPGWTWKWKGFLLCFLCRFSSLDILRCVPVGKRPFTLCLKAYFW